MKLRIGLNYRLLHLREMGTSGSLFSVIFDKGDVFCGFLIAFFFFIKYLPFRVAILFKRELNNFDRAISLEIVSIPLKGNQ